MTSRIRRIDERIAVVVATVATPGWGCAGRRRWRRWRNTGGALGNGVWRRIIGRGRGRSTHARTPRRRQDDVGEIEGGELRHHGGQILRDRARRLGVAHTGTCHRVHADTGDGIGPDGGENPRGPNAILQIAARFHGDGEINAHGPRCCQVNAVFPVFKMGGGLTRGKVVPAAVDLDPDAA